MEHPNTSTTEAATGVELIGANTVSLELSALLSDHVIPVFAKDNEPLISTDLHVSSAFAEHFISGLT